MALTNDKKTLLDEGSACTIDEDEHDDDNDDYWIEANGETKSQGTKRKIGRFYGDFWCNGCCYLQYWFDLSQEKKYLISHNRKSEKETYMSHWDMGMVFDIVLYKFL